MRGWAGLAHQFRVVGWVGGVRAHGQDGLGCPGGPDRALVQAGAAGYRAHRLGARRCRSPGRDTPAATTPRTGTCAQPRRLVRTPCAAIFTPASVTANGSRSFYVQVQLFGSKPRWRGDDGWWGRSSRRGLLRSTASTGLRRRNPAACARCCGAPGSLPKPALGWASVRVESPIDAVECVWRSICERRSLWMTTL